MISSSKKLCGCCVALLALAWTSCSNNSGTPAPAGTAASGGEANPVGGAGNPAASGGTSAGASGTGTGTGASGSDSAGTGVAGRASAGNGGASGVAAAAGSGGNTAGGGGAAGAAPVATTETVYVSGYGPDISVFGFDTKTGAMTKRSSVNGGTSPSYMAFAPNLKFAYAVNEADGANSKVVAFTVEPKTGRLTQLNSSPTNANGAPHLAVHPSGKWLAVAHYNSGHTVIMPIGDDGRVGTAGTPDKGPNGGCQNAHQAVFDRSGDHLLVPCLGSNYVIQYKFQNGMLSYNSPATVPVMGGPRHLALDPEQKHAYVLSEHESKITSFKYDATTGTMSDPQVIPSTEQTPGSSAHIMVHPSGKWLYASNRTENSIGLFSIDADGRPHPVSFVKDMIATPRDFSVDPSGRWLISANQAGAQNLLVFRIDMSNGGLTRMSVVDVGNQPTFTHGLVLE